MLSAEALLLAGGVAPLSTTSQGASADRLYALTVAHPALLGRRFVRLVAQEQLGAAWIGLNTQGFERAEPEHAVGYQQKRPLGFPAWAFVHHPEDARFVLDLMRDFRKAQALIVGKITLADHSFRALGEALERHNPALSPAFWDTVGRLFIEAGSLKMAAAHFERARTAERTHQLPVDVDLRDQLYLEFTLAEAVSARSLSAYVQDLSAACPPAEALQRYLTLSIQRTRGGLAPFTSLAKDLRALSKAAKVQYLDTTVAYLEAVLDVSALKRAPAGFWTPFLPALAAFAAKGDAQRAQVLQFWPKAENKSEKFVGDWLALMVKIGAVAHGWAAGAEWTRKWLEDLTLFAGEALNTLDKDGQFLPASYRALIEPLAAVLIEHDTAIDLAHLYTDRNKRFTYHADLLEYALRLGLALRPPLRRRNFEVGPHFFYDVEHLSAHPGFGPLLKEKIAQDELENASFTEATKDKPHYTKIRHSLLAASLEPLQKGGLAGIERTLKKLEKQKQLEGVRAFPDLKALLEDVPVAVNLQRSLAGGLLEEWTWPELEAVLRELSQEMQLVEGTLHLTGSLRFPIVRVGRQVIVFDGPTELRRYELPVKIGQKVLSIHYVCADFDQPMSGDLCVDLQTTPSGDSVQFWMSAPSQYTRKYHTNDGFTRAGITVDTPLDGQSVIYGEQRLRVGEALKIEGHGRRKCWDGAQYYKFISRSYGARYHIVSYQWDPVQDTLVENVWPEPMRAASEREDGMQFNAASLRWLPKGRPDSPLGQRAGWVGAWSRYRLDEHGRRAETEHTRIDGATHRGQAFSGSTWIKMPGATALCPIDGDWHYSSYEYDHFTIFDAQGQPLSRFGPRGIPPALPGFYPRDLWLSYLTPRDVRISTLLRAVDLPLAQRLLAAATEDQPFSVDNEAASARLLGDPQEHWPQTFAAVSAHFGDPSASADAQAVLLGAITKMVGQARLLELRVRPAQPEGGPVERPWIYDDHLAGWLPLKPEWAHGERSILHSVPQILAALSGERAAAEVDLDSLLWKLNWPLFIDALPRLLAFFLLRGHQPAEQRGIYRTALEILIEDCPALFGGQLHVGVLQTAGDSGFFDEQTEAGAKFWRTLPDGRLSLIVVHERKFWLSGRKEFHFWWIALDRGQGALTLPASVTGEILTQTLADDRDFLRATLDLYDAQGPVPYDLDTQAKILDEAAQRALLSQSGARWLWAGLPIPEDGYRDFLGKTLTSLLQVKLGEVIEARKWLMEELPERARVEFFADCTRVSKSADLWGAEGVAQFVRAAHNAWPRPAPVASEAFLEGCKGALFIWGSEEEQLRRLIALPERGFNETELYESIHPHFKYRALLRDPFANFVQLMPYLANTLPVGDALLELLPVAYAQLRAHAAPDDFVELPDIHLPDEAGRDHFFTHFEADEQQIPQDEKPPLLYKEDAQLLVIYDVERDVLRPYLRVQAALDPAATLALFTALYGEEAESNLSYARIIPAVRWLCGPQSTQLIERPQSTPVPAGQLEADPRLSAPEVVAKVRAKYGVSEEAAALYLLILVHAQPKTKTIQEILGWKPAAYRKASAELVAAELLIADKRAKTGRAHFLPGPWSTERPLEVWKLDQLERGFIRPQQLLPWFVAYPQIWARVEAGDGPKA